MGNIHGRLGLYWLTVLTIGSGGLVILSRQRRPDETLFVLRPFAERQMLLTLGQPTGCCIPSAAAPTGRVIRLGI